MANKAVALVSKGHEQTNRAGMADAVGFGGNGDLMASDRPYLDPADVLEAVRQLDRLPKPRYVTVDLRTYMLMQALAAWAADQQRKESDAT